MNLCHAIVTPDCSKPKVQKAKGIQKALVHLLIQSYATNNGDTVLDDESGKAQLENEETVILGSTIYHHSWRSRQNMQPWSQIFFIFLNRKLLSPTYWKN